MTHNGSKAFTIADLDWTFIIKILNLDETHAWQQEYGYTVKQLSPNNPDKLGLHRAMLSVSNWMFKWDDV